LFFSLCSLDEKPILFKHTRTSAKIMKLAFFPVGTLNCKAPKQQIVVKTGKDSVIKFFSALAFDVLLQ
jgi:hypothetical protein